ncbi:hypothetical protein [Nodosilinea sp. FACHB-13]|uniref:hypothetical protein n=1 Tax=Cyanophyceae TaxID=3028117 RepID=UPI001689FD16|nr:hypothetical protein [Nodosilinea sp. FACHB-13]MBD2109270.1 hypothetical protein [Nodosilinea sp. FACHB-13]
MIDIAFEQVASFAGLAVNFSGVKGHLSLDNVPSDGEIETIWAAIANPGWKWVYGLMATYGLCPHEVLGLPTPKALLLTLARHQFWTTAIRTAVMFGRCRTGGDRSST